MPSASAPPSRPCSLSDVLFTEELNQRDTRAPSLTEQNAAFHQLARSLTLPPQAVLSRLLHCALRICGAGTAGISALEEIEGERVQFRWINLEGALKHYVGGTTPRDHSPCGVTLDRGTPQLFKEPGRFFEYLATAEPPIREGLVVPIFSDDLALGSIWVVGHHPKVIFDMEDARVMESLAGFAGFALRMLRHEGQSTAEFVARKESKTRGKRPR